MTPRNKLSGVSFCYSVPFHDAMPKPHVILDCDHFPPGPEMGAIRPYRFYKYLKRMGYACHVITASAQPESNPDVTFIEDELRPIWEGTGEQKKSFKAYQELLVRKLAFPGHIGIMWSFAAAAHCHQLVRKYRGESLSCSRRIPRWESFLRSAQGLTVTSKLPTTWKTERRNITVAGG